MTTIYVDADACPVKAEILKVAERRGLSVVFVANTGLRPSRDPMVRNVIVSGSFDAADDWIVENAQPGDIAVTGDIPLAARLVASGVIAISNKGRIHDETSIGMTSAMRNLSQDLREAGAITSWNAPFGPRDRSAFIEGLEAAIRRAKRPA
ncbi:MAG: YaiI/YqxD family protein [Nitratireductor sp.]|nr:YaiI/YqxD family protein [Nitratireductor sp.]